MKKHTILQRFSVDEEAERRDVVASLMAPSASVSPKYFYDHLGCALYGAICQLPEYYPTRTEVSIFRNERQSIAEAAGSGKQFVDLGAGDCCKAQSWLPFLMPKRYVAVDIAGHEIDRALGNLSQDYPEIDMVGVVTDFSRELDLTGAVDDHPVTFFYPGSSIGNFAPDNARAFLQRIFAMCASRPDSGLLIGVDAKKSLPKLVAAYDDALGVTAAFNRNILLHLNRRFGFDFDLSSYCHQGLYNSAEGRIEMHLEAIRDHVVHFGSGHSRTYAAGERIHTENSYKYSAAEFEGLLREAGFGHIERWSDADQQFNVFYAR